MGYPDVLPSTGGSGYTIDEGYKRLFDAIVSDAIIEHALLTVGSKYTKEVLIPISGSTKKLENYLKTSAARAKVLDKTFLHPMIEQVETKERQLLKTLLHEFKDFAGIETETVIHPKRQPQWYSYSRSEPGADYSYFETFYYYGTPLLRIKKNDKEFWKDNPDLSYQKSVYHFLKKICRECESHKFSD